MWGQWPVLLPRQEHLHCARPASWLQPDVHHPSRSDNHQHQRDVGDTELSCYARSAIKNLRGEYYLNGHWVIEFSRATPIAGTMLYYQRGAEGESVPETIIGRGPTTEPLVVELISQEPNQGIEYEYYLPHGRSREGYYWSFGSWSSCSRECGSGYQSRLVFCTIDNEAYPDYLCASLLRPQSNRTCNPHPCPQTQRMAYLYPPQLWRSFMRLRVLR
ncbi:papilin [Fundulus heteroclitus]|uniref:papilin n=1 Tax=Fundulus heteroclitus TaxID=8078 RepID=UPI00165C3D8D|nr:papilin [Fundulus heteroclitus]